MKGEQGTIGQKGNAGEQGLPVSFFNKLLLYD
jgi:hypothetical protein